jgi:hypothetical protein
MSRPFDRLMLDHYNHHSKEIWSFDATTAKENGMRGSMVGLVLIMVLLAGCGGNPYLDASLKPAEMEGKEKAWFEKNWGAPSGKAPRFFGGEEWTYFRIAGGKSGAPFFNFAPNQCQITLKFDKEEKLNSYKYSGC